MAKKDRDDRDDELVEAEEGGASRVYELGFHLDPELPTEAVKEAYQAMRGVIDAQGAIVAEGEPEKIPLAYTISRQETSGRRDFDSAFFSWVAYETSAENHAKVLEAAGSDKRIVRFIDVVTDKEAARHAAEMRLMAEKMLVPEDKAAETVSDAELDAALENAAA